MTLLVRQLGGLGPAAASVAAADPRWLGLALLAVAASYLAAGMAQLGGIQEAVPLGRLVAAQVACAFTNRLLPAGIGGLATNVRCLRRSGLTRRGAATAASITAVAGILTHLLALAAALPLVIGITPVRHLLVTNGPQLVAAAAALGLLLALVAKRPAALQRILRGMGPERAHLAALVRRADRMSLLLAGSLGVTTSHAAAFLLVLQAVGATAPVPLVIGVYVVAVAVAGVIPAPGGAGALDVALLTGLTAAGVPGVPAATSVLAFRLMTFWLPTVPGVVALIWLLRRRLV